VTTVMQHLVARLERDGVPTSSQVNEAFLREVLAFIELHQDRWDQRVWAEERSCGTTHCLAGWAVTLAEAGTQDTDAVHDFAVEAARLLGLSAEQAAKLFFWYPRYSFGESHATFAEMCQRVQEVTGVEFKSVTDLVLADVGGAP
jgi:hypothetical protein